MARSFSFTDLLNTESMKEAVKTGYAEKVDIGDIAPSDDNFYDTTDVASLKESILLIGVKQPVIINLSHEEGGRKYRMVSGHRRLRACTELADEGYDGFRYIPAIICDITDPDEEKAVLIMTNSTQRVLSNWEKVNQYMELKPALKNLKEKRRVSGRARAVAAEAMGVSESQIANYNLIGTWLIAPLMELFKADGITMELAAEAARLEPDEQEMLAEVVANKGTFTREDIDWVFTESRFIPIPEEQEDFFDKSSESEIIPGQQSVEDVDTEYKDSVGEETEYKETVTDDKNVPVTGTFYEQGVYEPKMVDDLITEFTSYKDMSSASGDGEFVRKYSCIVDALILLKDAIGKGIE